MSCAFCGTPLAATARFCGACGRPLQAAPAPAPQVGFDETLAANSDQRALGYQDKPPPARPRADSHSETLFNQRAPILPPLGGTSSSPAQGSAAHDVSAGDSSADSADSDDIYIGTILKGRFAIKRKLGEGGFGAVYGGVQEGTGRQVAIKLLHPEMTRDRNVVARFRREGQVLCNLRDAHTITTYDFDQTEDGTLFIAMELLEGESLHDVFHNEAPIEWRRMVKFIAESCSSLAEAHAQGIIHRDLKPENIHLEKRSGNPEFVKILDFGIAKVVHGDGFGRNDQPQLTATGQTLGTLEYMSPEQLMGKELDGRSDIYGLGVVAYELLTGQLPFPDATGPAALIAAQLRKVPPPPSQVNQKIPLHVDGLILKMLEKTREGRHADVDALRVACNKVLAGDDSNMTMDQRGRASAMPPGPGAPGHHPGQHGQAIGQPSGGYGGPNVASVQPRPGYPGGPHSGQDPSASFPRHPVSRPMGPATQAELAATRKNRAPLFIGIFLLLALVGAGVALALSS